MGRFQSAPLRQLLIEQVVAETRMVPWREFLDEIAAIPEGDGTLRYNRLILAHTDCSIAMSYAVVSTCFPITGNTDPISRISLTMKQDVGVQL
jgi:hypothetical protein